MVRQYSRPQQSERKPNQATSRQSSQYGNRQGGFPKPSFPFQPYYKQQSYSGYSNYDSSYRNNSANHPYQSQQSQQGSSRQANPALPAPRQPLQITAGNTSNSTGQSSNQPRNPRSGGGGFGNRSSKSAGSGPNRGRGQYPSRPFGRQGTAYQGNESFQGSEAYHGSETDDSATIDQDSTSQDSQEPDNYYADEEDYDYLVPRPDDETEGYFATISPPISSYQYRKYQMIFLSKNKLYRHLGNLGRGRRASKSTCQGQGYGDPEVAFAATTSGSEDSQEIIKSTSDS